MSTKSTIKYAESKDLMFHLYYCFVKGYCAEIRIKNFEKKILIDKKQAEQITKELNENAESFEDFITLSDVYKRN